MEGSERVKRIGLMSAVGGEGKTTLAIMLSLILAEQPDEKVLLVDCDLRHRDVETTLGLGRPPGSPIGSAKPHRKCRCGALEGTVRSS